MEEQKLEMMELSSCEKLILGCMYSYEQKTKKRPELKALMQWTSEKQGRDWKPQTVCTFISRMEKKGLLKSEKVGRVSYYEPVVTYEMYIEMEMKELCNVFFDGDMKKMKSFVRKNL